MTIEMDMRAEDLAVMQLRFNDTEMTDEQVRLLKAAERFDGTMLVEFRELIGDCELVLLTV